MKVTVELKAPQNIKGLRNILEQWETQFPSCPCSAVNAYGTFIFLLDMPQATQVILPQITDASGTTED